MPYHDDDDVQYVPDAAEVGELVNTQLEDLLHHVVEDEHAEDHLTAQDEIIPGADVPNQLDCSNLVGGDRPAGRGELNHKPERSNDTLVRLWTSQWLKLDSVVGLDLMMQNMLMFAL